MLKSKEQQLRVLQPNFDSARGLFLNGSILAQVGNGKNKDLIPARQAWQEAGVPEPHIAAVLNETGLRHGKEPLLNVIELTNLLTEPDVNRLLQELERIFTPFYQPVQLFLDKNGYNPDHGFHSHTLEHHIRPLVKIFLRLIEGKRISVELRNRVLLALFMHDIGNAFSRSHHALLLQFLLPLLFRTAAVPEGDIGAAILAAVTHDEKTGALPLIEELLKKANCTKGDQVTTEKAQELQVEFDAAFTDEQCWLWLLDKSHHDRERTNNTRILIPAAMEADDHFLATIGHKVAHIGMSGKSVFEIRYDFSAFGENGTIPENIQVYKEAEDGRLTIAYPDRVKHDAHKNGISYFDHSVNTALRLYKKRWLLAALSAFKLYGDEVQQVRLSFRNTDIVIGGSSAQERSHCWTRAEVWQELQNNED